MMGGMVAAQDPRVLVVEDNEDNRRILVYRLQRMGIHRIDEATNGLEAVEIVSNRCPSLIIMDMMMPVMDGFDAMKTIRAMPNGAGSVPIIALTACCLDGTAERCFAAGASAFLAKPITDAQQLIAMVRSWIGERHCPTATTAQSEKDQASVFQRVEPLRGG